MSQAFFPIGINRNSSVEGPFFEVQDRLTLTGVAQGTYTDTVTYTALTN